MSRTTVHNVLLVLLTMTSGCVDAISFLGLGQVFTAAMTGNTVLFGLAVAHTDGLSIPGYAVALLGFIIGAAAGAIILSRNQNTTGWGKTVTISLCLELAALVLFAVVVSATPQTTVTGVEADALISMLAFAMGVQGVAARRIGVTGVTTTVITSTLTGLVESVVWKLGGAFRPSADSGEDAEKVAQKAKTGVSILSITMWISVIIIYGIGAAICGGLERYWHLQAVWLPIAIVFLVIIARVASGVRIRTEQRTGMSM